MRPKIADYILLELSLTLGLIYVLWPVRSVFAQCSNWMTPSYSEYATSSSDGTYVYTSVIASGTTYGACPGGCGNICPSTTHTIGALSLTPSTSSCTGYGWTYEPPEPWGSWLDWVNNQQVAAAPGTLVGFCSEGAVICSFVGQFWNTPIAYNTAASYTRIQHNYSRNPLPQLCWISSFFDAVRAGHTHHAEDVVYDNGKGDRWCETFLWHCCIRHGGRHGSGCAWKLRARTRGVSSMQQAHGHSRWQLRQDSSLNDLYWIVG